MRMSRYSLQLSLMEFLVHLTGGSLSLAMGRAIGLGGWDGKKCKALGFNCNLSMSWKTCVVLKCKFI